MPETTAAVGSMTGRYRRGAVSAFLLVMLCASGASAQSITAGGIEGRVTDPSGRPVRGAQVVLGSESQGRSVTVSGDGRFGFALLLPGSYPVRVEALGSRPLVVLAVLVDAGVTTKLDLVLDPAAPPVDRVDTLSEVRAPSAVGGAVEWARPPAITALPRSRPELASLLSPVGRVDESLGIEGLPERLTTLYVDGYAFQPARYPGSAGDPARGLLVPRSGLAAVALPLGSDVEWYGGAGGAVALSTGVDRAVPELFGSWGGEPGWSAKAVEGSPPRFASAWGGAAASAGQSGTMRAHGALEGGRLESPFPALLPESVAAGLGEGNAGLGSIGIRRSTWTSGALRLAWTPPRRQALQLSLAAANFSRTARGLSSQGAPYPGSSAAFDGTDVVGGANLSVDLPDRFALEVRVNGSVSTRRFGDAGVPSTATLLVDPSVALGRGFEETGDVTRMGVGATGLVHVDGGSYRAKLGVSGGLAMLDYDVRRGPAATFLFGRAGGVQGAGIYSERGGSKPAVSFTVPRAEVFAQYRWTPSPSLTFTLGGRYALSLLPVGDIRPDERWAKLTGVPNVVLQNRVKGLGGIVHAVWEPQGGRPTSLEGGLGLELGEVDPAALYEALANNGTSSTRRVTGNLAGWPAAPAAGRGTSTASLTILDPSLELPRTNRLTVAFTRQLDERTSLRAEIAMRQTDFLMRRSDLNAPVRPAFTGEGGRPVLAPLAEFEGVVGPVDSSWRRFPDYDAVWALNSDGWSRYRAFSLDLTRRLAGGTIFFDYTLSHTTDNLWGLSAEDVPAALVAVLDPTASFSWAEGTSDLDVPHRLAVGLAVDLPTRWLGRLGGVYRLRSGSPFTPMVARGFDVNGDGSWSNDVAWAPNGDETSDLLRKAGCGGESGALPERNSCRGPAFQQIDLSLTLGSLALGRGQLEIGVELLNVTDQAEGVRDDALVRVAPGGAIVVQGSKVTLPYQLNPGFGSLRARSDPGRMLRLGLKLGAR